MPRNAESNVIQGQLEAKVGVQSAVLVPNELPLDSAQSEEIVSFHANLPLPLHQAMSAFIERCPNWDQYRLVQAALAGFLVQNGVESRELTRLYVGKMFRRDSLRQGV